MSETELVVNTELQAGLDPEQALRHAEKALRCGEVGAYVAGFYLADIADRGGFRATGPGSLRHLVTVRLRRDWRTLQNYMSVARGLRELPVIRERFAEGRLNYSQLRILVVVATPETDGPWADWAEAHTLEELKAQAATREKGQLATEAGRRRLHEPRMAVGDRFAATEYEQIRRAKAKLEAMTNREVSDGGLIMFGAQLVLSMAPDGTVPGFKRVNDRHYLVHAWSPDGTPRLVTTGANGETVALAPEGLTGHLEPIPFSGELKIEGEIVELAVIDPENAGPEVPHSQRDVKTPDDLRDKILLRDGFQCRFCHSKKNVQVHHRVWRRYGGKTVPSNLVTVCEVCHAQLHARLLVIRGGDASGELTFVDRKGRPFVPRPAQPVRWSPHSAAPASPAFTSERVTLETLPAEVDAEWLGRNQHLLDWSERQGELVLSPGHPCERELPPASPPSEPTSNLSDAAAVAAVDSTDTDDAARPSAGLVTLFGQTRVREQLELAIAAAQQRSDALKHLVFTGQPGLGKTALARAVAVDLGVTLTELSAPHVRSPEQLVRALTSLDRGGVLFLDELHALPPRAAEVLYEALDRRALTLPVREGLRSRTLRVRLQPFTLVGAMTDEHLLPRALLSRLRAYHLEPYRKEELSALLLQASRERGLELTPEGAERVALASRDTPRRALALLDMVRDEATVAGATTADLPLVDRTLNRAGVDAAGLDGVERRYLQILKKANRPIGLKTLASRLHVSVDVLRSVHEPHLIRRGYVQVTREGRVVGDRWPAGVMETRVARPDREDRRESTLTAS